ncbi:MAG: helix-turn-helix domain-containing protein [Candidatus Manganitrophus sp.]|nr:helix-turn-helix domain-containing protein [Candidatus Manganitrophus sp.]MDC4227594.1 helix-turn-helix domain-containing protein [Candidatus Manganitrophus sp.]WDT70720.1 MAG: helix-turn-helix domain-containing protein [Candidatus Manganitrophus sp.]WDT82013.1 MAG: helix-turn-helix domain-containing protein [Candidatus Manganitrophus sp.]
MTRQLHSPGSDPRHVSLVALPDAVVSTLSGIYDVMNAFTLMNLPNPKAPFRIEIVGEKTGLLELASGVPIQVQRPVAEIKTTDIVIVPSVLLRPEGWKKGRYPGLVDWLRTMYDGGAVLCSACSGIFLLAETGLFDGKEATVHFGYAGAFAAAYPAVPVHPERVLIISGAREELVSSGASTSWHDMALYLIARYAGATAAQEVARLYALQWHQEGLTPYIVFEGKRDHGDGDIQSAQQWLDTHFSVAHPVEEMIKRSRLAERTFKRRFTQATGLTPLAYVQRLRIEDAKRRLERTEAPIDKISWQVGYEDAAFFRRLFKRTTGMAPGAYRKRFRIPDFARP